MIFDLGRFLTINFLYFSLAFASAIALLSINNFRRLPIHIGLEVVLIITSQLIVLWGSYMVNGYSPILLFPLSLSIVLFLVASKFLPGYSATGKYFLSSHILLLLFGIFWSSWFISSISISPLTRLLMLLGAPLIIFTLPSAIVQFIEQFEVLCRKHWFRPRHPVREENRSSAPKVCLQVPIYSEPPEIVIETLNILSQLDYPNFEVLVIDNNTKDEALWKPVEKHCKSLGESFHFFHVDPIEGAKAGALNFALTQTAPDVEIIGVIDADYHADKRFLKELVGHFDDPNIGFVQTPHDYRNWEQNAYLRLCYFEYKIFFHTTMVSLNEKNAGLTVGTMCLIRREALEKAGGWAEWCVTEDSELAIRIHAIGYSSVYLTESFGKGLIPETFAGYKGQRYRWTAGPVQEFKHHFKLLFLWPWQKPSLLTYTQRIHHLNHGLDNVNKGLGLFFMPLGFGVISSMIFHKEIIAVPFELWLGATVLLISGIYLNFLLYKTTLACSIKDTIGAFIAGKALSHTISIASFKTIFQNQTPWHRTNKFKLSSKFLRAVSTTKTEFSLGMAVMLFVIISFMILPLPGLILMFLIGLSYKGFNYLSAPAIAFFAELNNKN